MYVFCRLGNLRNDFSLTRCYADQVVSIDMLPDDVLVEIFDVFVNEAIEDQDYIHDSEVEAWQSLVHVCRRWRSIVFASPRCLNLRLACSSSTPAGDVLDIWPALPLLVRGTVGDLSEGIQSDNIIAALEHSDRVCHIVFEIPSLPSQNFWAAMRGPFPALTILHLSSDVTLPVVPDSFLGGFAPRLQDLSLFDIPIPGLPKLLMTATHHVILHLLHIPHSGYISPETMATCLSASTSLEQLHLEFQSSLSRPDREDRCPPPPTRSVLPALTWISFSGYSEYMEFLVARIDAPLLDCFSISFWNQLAYDTPQLVQFISRTPKLKAPDEAKINFSLDVVQFSLPSSTVRKELPEGGILYTLSNQNLSILARARSSSFLPLSTVKTLYIEDDEYDRIDRLEPWHCDIDWNLGTVTSRTTDGFSAHLPL
jgi:hypothetical protein